MIEYIYEGSIFDSGCEGLVNPVNCVGAMGSGLAKEFKERYPDMFRDYKIACDAGRVRTGKVLPYFLGLGQSPLYILNVPTKFHWRDNSHMMTIDSGLRALVLAVKQLGLKSVAVPALGCGKGGLKWVMVEPLITQRLIVLEADVKVYLPK